MKGIWTLLILAILFSGCDYTDALLKDGKMIRKEVLLGSIERIEIDTSVELVLTNGRDSVVVVEGLDFLVPRLVLNQEGDVLKIESEGLIGFREKQLPTVTVGVSGLKRITSNFPSRITNTDTLKLSSLSVVINGRGTFTQCDLLVDAGTLSLAAYGSNVGNHIFRGKADKLIVNAEGLSTVDALQLKAKTVRMVQKSVNSSYVNAVEALSVDIFSSGNVYYIGNPDTTLKIGDPLYEVELGTLIKLTE
ncbi:GIN domain-containing protein [Marinilabilia salmonicolor]|jgi:hypothetical protein|uniref:Putative autotransporter adhesin-like protein n=1 Tax=Marinilabilia salmonicolor TaxID=989 RepID=A0A2T0XPR9_9BACT|nr:DUF2807 domain-containing protein [Marinilabilia salmonicolor]PRZ00940.1 putative autotransporter adhesin-like protein [Marinilabilia salmonicolor]RCW31059.1 putative autotransporter adhesin-like protein [Marinilabilia salmonicolor]